MSVWANRNDLDHEGQTAQYGGEDPHPTGSRYRLAEHSAQLPGNISDVTFHRWKSQFGLMDLNVANRSKELESEKTELKKMLAEAMLANKVL